MLEVEEQLRQHARWIRPQMAPVEITGITIATPGQRLREPSRRVWLLVAAAALVAVLLASVGLVASRADRRGTTPIGPTTSVTATGPRSALVPTWLPSGLHLLQLTTERPGEIPYPHDLYTAPYAMQLFGSDGQPAIEVEIQPTYGGIVSWGGADTTVRGLPANQPHDDPPDARLRWIERGALVTATAKPTFAAQLRSFVTGLRWAGLRATDGFLAPAGSTLAPLAPTFLATDGGVGLHASFVYAPDPSSDHRLDISTCPDGIGDCSGLSYENYLDVWFHGHRNADGSATAERAGNGAASYVQAWPHGGAVDIETDGVRLDATGLAPVVAGLRVVDATGLAQLRRDITHQALQLPVLVSTDLAGGKLELRGTRYGPWALCVETSELPLTCPGVSAPLPKGKVPLGHGAIVDPSAIREMDVSLLVHGHWLVAAVTVRPQARLSFPILKNAELPGPAQSIPASTASVTVAGTSYHFGMAQAPDSAYSVGIVENVPNGAASSGAYRPGF